MSQAYYFIPAAILLALLLWGGRKYLSRQKLLAELSALLEAKAAGTIDAEEYARRQDALHAALLARPTPASKNRLTWGLLAGASLILAVTFGVQKLGDKPNSEIKAAPEWWADVAAKVGETPVKAGAMPAMGQANSGGDLETMAKRLADKLAADPNNGEGWALLGKTYSELRQYPEAAAAYAKADRLIASDAQMLADWADAQVMAKAGKWDDEARSLVKRAVAKDAKHLKALALSGSEAFDHKDYGAAIDFWKRLLAVAEVDSMDARLAEANIAEAEALRSGKRPAPSTSAAPSAQIAGVVALAQKFTGRVAPGDTVFVVAKTPEGGAPLAVWRYQGNDFPIEFRLDDSNAVVPGRSLSQYSEVTVSARISRSGNADPAKGDLLSPPVKAALGSKTVALNIDSER